MPPPTILTLKQSFLNHQTRQLSQPLAPSRAWRTANDSAAEHGVAERALDDALAKLNRTLEQHARRAYPPQATRHVAEQIDALYWAVGEQAVEQDAAEGESEALSTAADFAHQSTITALPSTWDDPSATDSQPLESARYTDLVSQLQALAAQRETARARVARLRALAQTLAPFAAAAGGGVQENLVTRDGAVERELERMRMLLARVGDRVARLEEGGGGEGEEGGSEDMFRGGDVMVVDDVEVEERRKVGELLGRF